ncbi:PIN domain-containing protein [Inquilinus sp. CAU 1745]|uniref:PIN domain-containing protein n=1 Tax=Inquilinus sp. CAU 1745 TaxID=3140369 RepID=UPI00325BAF22
MRANRYTATIDACVLAGALPRNMVLSLAEAGFFRPRWSAEILAEAERAICSILRQRGIADPEAIANRHCDAIKRAFPEAMTERYEYLIPECELPDKDDRHVLAAAIQARSSVIVTENTKHFPTGYIASFDIIVSTTDKFLADAIDLDPPGAVAALRTMRQRFNRPQLDAENLILKMESAGLSQTANLLIGEIDSL